MLRADLCHAVDHLGNLGMSDVCRSISSLATASTSGQCEAMKSSLSRKYMTLQGSLALAVVRRDGGDSGANR